MPEEAIEALNEILDVLGCSHYSNSWEYIAVDTAIQALEKQIPKKPKTDDNRILCPTCNLLIAYNKSIEQHCWTCGQNLEGCVIE